MIGEDKTKSKRELAARVGRIPIISCLSDHNHASLHCGKRMHASHQSPKGQIIVQHTKNHDLNLLS